MNRLLIRGEPVGPHHYVYIFQEDKMVESYGIKMEDLEEIVFDIIKNYNISLIDLSGAHSYMEGIQKMLEEKNVLDYQVVDLTFRYV
jgi:hypothetical protein